MMESVETWGSVIKALGGPKRVGEALDESTSTVGGWPKRPGGVPGKHFSAIVRLAIDVGKPDITLEVLAAIAARHATSFDEARA